MFSCKCISDIIFSCTFTAVPPTADVSHLTSESHTAMTPLEDVSDVSDPDDEECPATVQDMADGSSSVSDVDDRSDVSVLDDKEYMPTVQDMADDSSSVSDVDDRSDMSDLDDEEYPATVRDMADDVDDPVDDQSCVEKDTGHKNGEEASRNWQGARSRLSLKVNKNRQGVSSPLSLQNASVTIPAAEKKANGKRMYNKKHYCVFCDLPFSKMARHLENKHSKERDVAYALSFTKGSRERRAQLELLRNRGNLAQNARVLESGTGTLVARKQPTDAAKASDYMHCVYCQGCFAKTALWRHFENCALKPAGQSKPGRSRVQKLCAFAIPPPRWVADKVWDLVGAMNQDDIAGIVKTDKTIMKFAEYMYNKHGSERDKHEYIRTKLRELGRLVLYGSDVTPLKNLAEYLLPKNFDYTVKAAKHTAVTHTKNGKEAVSLPIKLGHSLHRCSLLQESDALMEWDKEAAEAAMHFGKIYSARWNERVSGECLKKLNEARWNTELLLPLTEDVKKLHDYLEEKQQHYLEDLKNAVCSDNWKKLSKVTQTLILLFNRRRQGEVSKMPLTAFLSRVQSAEHEDVNYALSALEIELCRYFCRLEIRGKGGRKVPILLTPSMVASLELLCERRNECNVLPDNLYLFAVPNTMGFYRASDLLLEFVELCELKNPKAMKGTQLRKQLATLSTVLNLKATELDQLADFMGHNIRVHAKFYRLPENTLQLAKISKVLMAMEKGRVGEFHGKNLDEIEIDPNGMMVFLLF